MNKFTVEYVVTTVAKFRCCYCGNTLKIEKEGKQNIYKDEALMTAIDKGWKETGADDYQCARCASTGVQLSLLPPSNTGVNS